MKAWIPPAALAAIAALTAAASPASAAGIRSAAEAPRIALPGDVTASAVDADPGTWIVGTQRGAAAARIARAHGATRIAGQAWLAPRTRTRALAAALERSGLLDYAEPNRTSYRSQAPDPLSAHANSAWRARVVGDAVAPLAGPDSPLVAVVDTIIDTTHPEIAGSAITTVGGASLGDYHGTATATVAAGAANGVGMLGLWPGARTLNVPLQGEQDITCADSARGIARAVRAGAVAINMSYGSAQYCRAEEQAIIRAVKAGAVPVAAAGNEFQQGNPLEYPASLAHVLTVGAVREDDTPAYFSNESAAVDLAAPGTGILAAVPTGFDPGKDGDGYQPVDGTSFSAPMVSAAVAWIRAARPELTPFQAAQVVRLGARDVGEQGYESATGFGVLHLPGALAREAPADDPLEPNDDIRYIDGRAFGALAPPLANGGDGRVAATIDLAEDPVDVYRIKVRAGRRAKITLRPAVGDPDLFVFSAKARGVGSKRLTGRSVRKGDRTDRVTVRNRGSRTTTFYVAVGFQRGKRLALLNAGYALGVDG